MTRDLQCLQSFVLELDIGLWSGFKRKMEMAESFLQPPVTVNESMTPICKWMLTYLSIDAAASRDIFCRTRFACNGTSVI